MEHTLAALDGLERSAAGASPLHGLDARAKLLVTGVFLATMLSLPLVRLSQLLLYSVFPVLAAAAAGMRYRDVVRRSLFVLPLVLLVGAYDLFALREPLFRAGPLAVTEGAARLIALTLRAMLAVQASIVLIGSTGIYRICRALRRLGVPALFSAQLLLVYRYLYLLVAESIALVRARDARSFGRRAYPLAVWGVLVGQLLIRSVDRARRIGCAMQARGFTGELPETPYCRSCWTRRDTRFLLLWSAVLVMLRWFRPVESLTAWMTGGR